jgi:hypothetical protein
MNTNVQRFFKALNAKISIADEEFVRKYLSKQEQILFYKQRLADQRHSLDSAYYILRDTSSSKWANKHILINAALLHDIGKTYVFLPLWVRPVCVILEKYLHSFYIYLGKKGKSQKSWKIIKYFYAYQFHSEIGVEILSEIDADPKVLELIELHHSEPFQNEPKELPFLRRADMVS